jgi:hypothetical protein
MAMTVVAFVLIVKAESRDFDPLKMTMTDVIIMNGIKTL